MPFLTAAVSSTLACRGSGSQGDANLFGRTLPPKGVTFQVPVCLCCLTAVGRLTTCAATPRASEICRSAKICIAICCTAIGLRPSSIRVATLKVLTVPRPSGTRPTSRGGRSFVTEASFAAEATFSRHAGRALEGASALGRPTRPTGLPICRYLALQVAPGLGTRPPTIAAHRSRGRRP